MDVDKLAKELYDEVLAKADGDTQKALEIAAILLAEIEVERRAVERAASAGYMRRKANGCSMSSL